MDPKILRATVQHLVAWTSWLPSFVNPRFSKYHETLFSLWTVFLCTPDDTYFDCKAPQNGKRFLCSSGADDHSISVRREDGSAVYVSQSLYRVPLTCERYCHV